MINVCVPVLKRYDLLQNLLMSLEQSLVHPDKVFIIDNGMKRPRIQGGKIPIEVITPEQPLGVAESWNWFIRNVPEERVIVNDDVIFQPHSMSKLLASKADLVWADGCGFSCFILRDTCVQKIGLFDEQISPGYAYYEDDDYLQRLDGRGTRAPSAIAETVKCGVTHLKSQTLQAGTEKDTAEHHRKFKIAQGNYMRKWGLTTI